MLARTTKPPAPLSERIRRCADHVRTLDAEVKDVIEAWLDQEKLSQAGASLPRETLRQMLMAHWKQPFFAILGLEEALDRE